MRVFIYLIIFAVDIDRYANSLVLLKNGDILTKEMVNDSPSSFSMIEEMLKNSVNITGRWAEATPRLVGVLDDEQMIDTETNSRYIAIVYALHMPSKNCVNDGYKWVPISELEDACQNNVSKNIIRYAGTSI